MELQMIEALQQRRMPSRRFPPLHAPSPSISHPLSAIKYSVPHHIITAYAMLPRGGTSAPPPPPLPPPQEPAPPQGNEEEDSDDEEFFADLPTDIESEE
jgi:hypothetical protein